MTTGTAVLGHPRIGPRRELERAVEAARSGMGVLEDLTRAEFASGRTRSAWVDPDGGLTTRRHDEVVPALRAMVAATRAARAALTPA